MKITDILHKGTLRLNEVRMNTVQIPAVRFGNVGKAAPQPVASGIYLCVAASDPTQYQRYRLADGKYYIVKK